MTILKKTLLDFGFSNQESQLALLNIFNCAGYFSDQNIWQAINLMEFGENGKKETNNWQAGELKTFLSLKKTLDEARIKNIFNAEYFLQNAFNDKNIFDAEDVQDFLLYIGQTAFGRENGQERCDLVEHDWMTIYKDEYFTNAAILGFINEKKPHHKKYDESWIQGGARIRMIARINYLKDIQNNNIETGIVRILTGERELSIELDSISDDVAEIKNFILNLAAENNVKYDASHPFIKKNFGGVIKTCLNNIDGHGVTETMMVKKIYREVFGKEIINVVDSSAVEKIGRPTTQKNARDIIEGDLLLRIKNGDFSKDVLIKIMIISNQPYCNRQVGTIDRTTFEVLNEKLSNGEINHKYQMIFDGVGEASKSTVTQVHSVLGALISEDFLHAISNDQNKRKRDINNLMFASRHNDITLKLPNL